MSGKLKSKDVRRNHRREMQERLEWLRQKVEALEKDLETRSWWVYNPVPDVEAQKDFDEKYPPHPRFGHSHKQKEIRRALTKPGPIKEHRFENMHNFLRKKMERDIKRIVDAQKYKKFELRRVAQIVDRLSTLLDKIENPISFKDRKSKTA